MTIDCKTGGLQKDDSEVTIEEIEDHIEDRDNPHETETSSSDVQVVTTDW